MTYNDSVVLAKRLKELSPTILGVELFGSVLNNGYGRDADFLVLVEDALAKRWWNHERESIRVRWPDYLYKQRWLVKKFAPFVYAAVVHRRRSKRLKISANMLGIKLGGLAGSDGKIPNFEIFIMPANWRIGEEINADLMQDVTDLIKDRNTLGFLKRIAKNAVKVA